MTGLDGRGQVAGIAGASRLYAMGRSMAQQDYDDEREGVKCTLKPFCTLSVEMLIILLPVYNTLSFCIYVYVYVRMCVLPFLARRSRS